ncbi:MAG: subtilase [Halobacteriovoraceae bacterium]|nr:subtilase [Halobacteriovoraceae bacterium]
MKSWMVAGLLVTTSAFGAEYIAKINPQFHGKSALKALGAKDLNLSYAKFVKISLDQKSFDGLKNSPEFEYIEPNYTYRAINTPSDSDFEKQWGLENTGRNSGGWWSPGTAGVDISALEAWKITKGGKEIKIAVIDTGVDYNHEDLKNNIMINEAELNGAEGVDDDGNGYIDDVYGYDFANDDADPMDGHGHGTHCAGVIGAEHNQIGIAGVMANVQILPVQFLSASGGGTLEGALKAIDYATSRGVNIMSNSWGGGGRSEALFEAVQRAEQAGIVFVAAAGNESNDNDAKPVYPANYKADNVISVGAMDGKGKKASFSNWGEKTVHVFAPGVNIYSTVQGDRYKKMSGTSMACPHVSGIVGLLLSMEPNLSVTEVKQRLMSTSTQSTELDRYTASGYADAANALQ